MATTITEPLPVNKVLKPSANALVLVMGPLLGPLFISSIIITRVSTGPAVTGTLFPGTSSHPGHVTLNVNMDQPRLDALAAILTPFGVVLTFESTTRSVSDFMTIPAAPALAS